MNWTETDIRAKEIAQWVLSERESSPWKGDMWGSVCGTVICEAQSC